ncbi:OsmC family protein [Roseomonas gilardii subsp. gilardii]|uniref:OsmC family protein n=1 Tax=Roseomonas gilardii TaxID=257708 RepID=UPI001FF79A58|nr:OsmC family protein [Roseomonas gilardii]UPG71004.1 OsmC family protein [Roseomonas gilardii subsp. gilardii]
MAGRLHRYRIAVTWTGDRGRGTAGYRAYERAHLIEAPGKPPIKGSSDPAFRGDPACWNPEELLLASLSACHKLQYLHLCAEAGVVVTAYRDEAEAEMAEEGRGGRFIGATLRPQVVIRAGCDVERARTLHHEAHAHCFIASSVNFPVACEPVIREA